MLLVLAVLLSIGGLLGAHGAIVTPTAASHEHVATSVESGVLPAAPISDGLWPVCPAPRGHGDAVLDCGLGMLPLDVFADVASAHAMGAPPLAVPAVIAAVRTVAERAASLRELSISRT